MSAAWLVEASMSAGQRVPIVCANCGSPGSAYAPDILRGYGRYCSRACSHAARVIPVQDRLLQFTDKNGPGGCWIWTGTINPGGYGTFPLSVRGKKTSTPAHRAWYVFRNGPIDGDMPLDHLCRNRRCVNPDHMEPVTSRENTMRGETLPAFNALKTECKNGHPLIGYNVAVRASSPNHRRCRICARINARKSKASRLLSNAGDCA